MSTSQTGDQVHGEGVDENTQLANPRSKKRSRVWEFFKELPAEGKAVCIYCQSKLSYHQGVGVSHFRRHILTGCPDFPADIDRKAIFPVSDPVGDARGFVLDPAIVRDFMNKFWISASLAFRKIENGFFRKMMKSAHPSLHVHGRKTLKKDCVAVYEEEKKKIKASLANCGSNVSFTTDMWTSVQERHRPNRSRRSEVDIYLEDPLVPLREGESFDVLKWWKRNSEQYPILAKMVRDLLAIPLSSVASESTFSTAGMIINEHRSSLNPRTAEALICSKDWLKEYLSDEEDEDDD